MDKNASVNKNALFRYLLEKEAWMYDFWKAEKYPDWVERAY